MTFSNTKQIARHDKITIDGTEVSNGFRRFTRVSEDSTEDVSGFSVTGTDETLPGTRAQRFEGEAFYTEELGKLLEPLYKNRTVVEILWQPDGLVDATREVYKGNCTISNWSPENTRGSVSTVPFTALAADSTGIQVIDWT